MFAQVSGSRAGIGGSPTHHRAPHGTMRTMSSGGRRRAAPAPRSVPRLRLSGHIAGAGLTVVAWVLLVRAAIDFGALGREGEALAWVFTALATLGAIGCLLLAIVLATRMLEMLGLLQEQPPRRAAARRRAK